MDSNLAKYARWKAPIKRLVRERSRRVAGSALRLAAFYSLLSAPTMFMAPAMMVYVIVTPFVFAVIVALLYRRKAAIMLADGHLVPARPGEMRFELLSMYVPKDKFTSIEVVTQVSLFQRLMYALFVMLDLPPAYRTLELEVDGVKRLHSFVMCDDEEAVMSDDGRTLCVVSRTLWYMPPSPWVLKVSSKDGEGVREMKRKMNDAFLELYDASGTRPADFNPAVAGIPLWKMLAGPTILAGIAIILMYLPFLLSPVGWMVAGLLTFLFVFGVGMHYLRKKYPGQF